MGNRGLLRAMSHIGERLAARSSVPFGQVILAAPDVDRDLFQRLAAIYPRISTRTTLYASPKDRAVGLSRWLHSYPRAGFTPPITSVVGIDTIEVPSFDLLDLLGHGYFAEAEPLLYDIFDMMRHNAAPDARARIHAVSDDEGNLYWRMAE